MSVGILFVSWIMEMNVAGTRSLFFQGIAYPQINSFRNLNSQQDAYSAKIKMEGCATTG